MHIFLSVYWVISMVWKEGHGSRWRMRSLMHGCKVPDWYRKGKRQTSVLRNLSSAVRGRSLPSSLATAEPCVDEKAHVFATDLYL